MRVSYHICNFPATARIAQDFVLAFVDYDGITYECVSYLANGGTEEEPYYLPVIGNTGIIGLTSENNEPFFIGINRGKIFVYVETEGTHDIVLYNSVDSVGIKKLDKKYLPDDIGGASSWNNLTDKPFEVPTIYCEWNYNEHYSDIVKLPDGYSNLSSKIIKISEEVPSSPNFFVGKYIYVSACLPGYGLIAQDMEIPSSAIRVISENNAYSLSDAFIIVFSDTFDIDGVSLTRGVWIFDVPSYVFSYKITNAPVKKISDMVIPDTIARAAQIDDLITYGTNDLVAGESKLETGKLYFVYE